MGQWAAIAMGVAANSQLQNTELRIPSTPDGRLPRLFPRRLQRLADGNDRGVRETPFRGDRIELRLDFFRPAQWDEAIPLEGL